MNAARPSVPGRPAAAGATAASDPLIDHGAPISTWFGVGGGADALARPASEEELVGLVRRFAGGPIRILGDGANLLVDDGGVDGLVLDLRRLDGTARRDEGKDAVVIDAQAGVNLPRLIVEAVRDGLAGLEGLAGIPATVGGAIVMNAGGAFGQVSDAVRAVRLIGTTGEVETRERGSIEFGYRRSGLEGRVILGASFLLRRVSAADRPALRERLKEVMAYKKRTQPMADRSAGCFFKNPTVGGERVSAGRLIDLAGCKGLAVGGASVSAQHANFIVTGPGCTARDILALTDEVRRRVREHAGVELQNEVVVWRRSGGAPG